MAITITLIIQMGFTFSYLIICRDLLIIRFSIDPYSKKNKLLWFLSKQNYIIIDECIEKD